MTVCEHFVEQGYSFLGEGFSHYTFKKHDTVFKVAKDPLSNVNSKAAYDAEIEVMRLLVASGYPAIEIIDLLPPGCLHPDLWVLKETVAQGISYTQQTIPIEAERSMFLLFDMVQSISRDWFGNFAINHPVRQQNWKQYLYCQYMYSAEIIRGYSPVEINLISSLIDCIIDYEGPPRFLIMDSNVENFFFHKNNQLSAIIDIDHPIFGDPLYQLVSIRWYRGDRFNMYVNSRLSGCSKAVYTLYLYFIAVEDMAYRILQNLPVTEISNRYYEVRNEISSYLERR